MTMLLTAVGTSIVTESIFENRFRVVSGLARMGAQVSTYGRVAVVNGVAALRGAMVQGGSDLRGTAALVLAGLGADGVTVVEDTGCLRRGYARIVTRLRSLGAEISADGDDEPGELPPPAPRIDAELTRAAPADSVGS